MTGLPARYKDPKTNVPYANLEAYQTLQKVQQQSEFEGYIWSVDLGAFVGTAPTNPNPKPEAEKPELMEEEQVAEEESDAPQVYSRGTLRPPWDPSTAPAVPKVKRGRPSNAQIVAKMNGTLIEDDELAPAAPVTKKGRKPGPKPKGGRKLKVKDEPEEVVAKPEPKPRGPPKYRGEGS